MGRAYRLCYRLLCRLCVARAVGPSRGPVSCVAEPGLRPILCRPRHCAVQSRLWGGCGRTLGRTHTPSNQPPQRWLARVCVRARLWCGACGAQPIFTVTTRSIGYGLVIPVPEFSWDYLSPVGTLNVGEVYEATLATRNHPLHLHIYPMQV